MVGYVLHMHRLIICVYSQMQRSVNLYCTNASCRYIISPFSLVGVLLSAVLHTERKKAPFLIVLDAKTMDEVGRVQFEGIQMHKDFHGIFCEF